jgi:hypothetical protein
MSAMKTTLIVAGVVVALAGVGTLGYLYVDERNKRKQLSEDLANVLKQFEEVDTQIAEIKKFQTDGFIIVDDQSPAAVALFEALLANHQKRAEAKVKQATKETKAVKGEGSVTYMKAEYAPVKDAQPDEPVSSADVEHIEHPELQEMPGVSPAEMLKAMVNSVISGRLIDLGMNEHDAHVLMGKHDAAVTELAEATGNSGADLTSIEAASLEIQKQFDALAQTSTTFTAFVDEVAQAATILKGKAAANG